MSPKAKTKMFPELPSQGSREEILPLIPFLEAVSDPLTCVASKIRGKPSRKHITNRGAARAMARRHTGGRHSQYDPGEKTRYIEEVEQGWESGHLASRLRKVGTVESSGPRLDQL